MDTSRERRKMVQIKKQLKLLPINLRKKAIREARNLAGMQQQKVQRKLKKRNKQNDFERAEHNAMLAATDQELQQILADYEELADVPSDCTPAELLGMIATAEGRATTTIYVQRDGLSTLKIVLHQRSPTIAQLKSAIASIALAQHKRRQRNERHRALAEDVAGQHEDDTSDQQQQVAMVSAATAGAGAGNEAIMLPRSSCELVNSAQRNGHEHRALVSWRFLWRCFALFNVDTNQPIDDNAANGRATLTALGIENGSKLKFVHRVKYFGRKRQT
ncbi:uncharacterized protein LOC133850131 isoform X1 [Drosophila sulfurigaster albostrigata]|uniref:uncharacterized protein LOC133850131 isoform X1 n=1 Tax=Drosophila sulfurigaster albostrigata TaxID=89887 RepID=UPI002D21E18E|nr:uncharacterized protein LOC133850131 isoform X1 [Drosophila sulfurigaster albostrigata]